LAEALRAVEQTLAGLSDEEWRRPTLLTAFHPDQPHWDVLQLVGHFDISIGLTGRCRQCPGWADRARPGQLLHRDRSQVAPIVYDYAVAQVKETAPADALAISRDVPALAGRRHQHPPDTIGSGFFALMRLDDLWATASSRQSSTAWT